MTSKDYYSIRLPVCKNGNSFNIKNRAEVFLSGVKLVRSTPRFLLVYRNTVDSPMTYWGDISAKQFMNKYGKYFEKIGAGLLVNRSYIKGIILLSEHEVLFPNKRTIIGVDLGEGDKVGVSISVGGIDNMKNIISHHLLNRS